MSEKYSLIDREQRLVTGAARAEEEADGIISTSTSISSAMTMSINKSFRYNNQVCFGFAMLENILLSSITLEKVFVVDSSFGLFGDL